MNYFRGIVLLAAGCLALCEAWRNRTGERAWWAMVLGLAAIGIGIWRMTRKPDWLRRPDRSRREPDQDPGRRIS
jgi:uncharacterized membrane protein HdeD (DUF308 family)